MSVPIAPTPQSPKRANELAALRERCEEMITAIDTKTSPADQNARIRALADAIGKFGNPPEADEEP